MADCFANCIADELLADEITRSLRRQRIFRDRDNPFDMPDPDFIRRFRLSKRLAMEVIEEVAVCLPAKRRETTIAPETKILAALRFFATGSYQDPVGSDYLIEVSQSSVSRAIRDVSDAICSKLLNKWVKFPTSGNEITRINGQFMEIAGFPGVIGAIDCTHVLILKPPANIPDDSPDSFLNREGLHSVNVQLVCDANLKILGVNAKFPGSSHDAYIWRASQLRDYIKGNEPLYRNSWLLGDSGYPLEPWLLTPILSREVHGEVYNKKHRKTRNTIGRCKGLLKARFRCLRADRVLNYCPRRACTIINACVVLHNMCTVNNVPCLESVDGEEEEEESSFVIESSTDNRLTLQGRHIQEQLIQLFRHN